jgi:hypothetical protein
VCGQANTPEEEHIQGQRIDFDKLMSQGTFCLSNADKNNMLEKVPLCIQALLDEGQLRDSFLDEQGIVRMDGDTAEFSSKVYNQQHAHILNHQMSKARYINYRQKKLDAANPELQAALRALAENLRKQNKAIENQDRLEANKVKAAKKLIDVTEKKKIAELEKKRLKELEKEMDPELLANLKATEKKRKADRAIDVKNAKARKIEEANLLIQNNQTV